MVGLADELVTITNYTGHGSTSELAIKFINAGLASLIMMLINYQKSRLEALNVRKSRKGGAKPNYDWFVTLRFSATKPIKVRE